MKRRHAILLAGLVSAGGVAALGDRAPENVVIDAMEQARPVNRPAHVVEQSATEAPQREAAKERARAILAISQRGASSPGAWQSTTGEIFESQTWVPPPPPSPPPPKPAAPPLPFVYLGKLQQQGTWVVFLGRDGDTIVVKSNDSIGDTYQVEAINPPAMTLKYLPLNETQQLTIE